MKKIIALSIIYLAFYLSLSAQCIPPGNPILAQVCTYNSNGTYTVPTGYIVTILVQAWGGGGSGGSGGTNSCKGGGGAGAYASSVFTNVSAGSYAIEVGAGGVADGNIGHAGGASRFVYFNSVVAAGGLPGSGATGGQGGQESNCQGDTKHHGGNGIDGITSLGIGGDGGGAVLDATGLLSTIVGLGGVLVNACGNVGVFAGGGGGGKATGTCESGNGQDGQVTVTVLALSSLPVELTKFEAKPLHQNIDLSWETASENNNEKFIIERSFNGSGFLTIGEVRGNGTSTNINQYHFIDKNPNNGDNYYRLKQIDNDGNFEYSYVETVAFKPMDSINIYPTITKNELNIIMPQNSVNATEIAIFSIHGLVLFKQKYEDFEKIQIPLSELPNGQYVVQVNNGNYTQKTQIFKL
ncbi:MAG: T9SS type A sorting domain-containing protein [Bacteroidetes bacterium]|nr:T9SS type A sorting domain-containing protein [Bacteroidota bacterium]